MRTHIEFRSSKFPPYEGEEQASNSGLWGQRLAEYLRQKLPEQGIATREIYVEDWGWVVPLHHEAFPMWIGCGRCQEHEDAYLVFIHPSTPTVRKWWLKKVDTRADVARVADALDRVLATDPDIRDRRWRAEDER